MRRACVLLGGGGGGAHQGGEMRAAPDYHKEQLRPARSCSGPGVGRREMSSDTCGGDGHC